MRDHLPILVLCLCVAALTAGCAAPESPPFEAARVVAHVEAQCAFGPRVPNSAARDSAAAYIAHTLERLGADVTVQPLRLPDPYSDATLKLLNVVARFEPGRERRVMLASHYDSRPWADQEPDTTLHDRPIPGAVDGACSAGILLELARLVSVAMPEEIGVDLLFFDGEDYGKEGDLEYYLLGSAGFVAGNPGYRPEKAILLDMVGGVGTRSAREGYSTRYAPVLLDSLFARARALGLDYFHDEPGAPIYDDHVPFLRAGVEMVDLFGYEYAHWHTLGDTPDKCDTGVIAQVGALLVDFLYRYPFR